MNPRRAAALALLLGCGLAAGLTGAAELFVRWRIRCIPASTVPSGLEHPPYYNNPGVVTSPRAFGFHLSYTINAEGLRGPEIGSKPPGVKRLLLLGDSVVFGAMVPENQTLSAQLEALLNGSGPKRWEVLNGGVGSYDAWDYEPFLRLKGLALKPDAVVVGLYVNDHIQRQTFVETTRTKSAPNLPTMARLRDLALRSELVNTAMYWLQRNQPAKHPRIAVEKHLTPADRAALAGHFSGDPQTPQALAAFLKDYHYDPQLVKDTLPWLLDLGAWRQVEAPLKDLARTCRAQGLPLYGLVFPVQFEAYPGYAWPEPHATIASLFKKAGIKTADLLEDFRTQGADELYLMRYDIAHPNEKAYAIAARRLAGLLAP